MADNTPPVIPLLTLSVLPLKNTVLFPTMFMPLSVGRPASLAAFELVQTDTPLNVQQLVAQAGDPLRLVYMLGSMMSLDVTKEQLLLEAPSRQEALRLLHEYLAHELQVLELRHKIATRAQTEMR